MLLFECIFFTTTYGGSVLSATHRRRGLRSITWRCGSRYVWSLRDIIFIF